MSLPPNDLHGIQTVFWLKNRKYLDCMQIFLVCEKSEILP